MPIARVLLVGRIAGPPWRRAWIAAAGMLCCAAHVSGADSLFIGALFQRTAYTDNLNSAGHWWANPALPADFARPGLVTTNALPLSNRLMLATARLFWPVSDQAAMGVGLLGAGPHKRGSSSSSATQSGVRYRGEFDFSRPRIQFGAALRLAQAGKAGAFGSLGADLEHTGSEQSRLRPSFGIACGWISPPLFAQARLSLAYMAMYRAVSRRPWEHGIKAGVCIESLDSLWDASLLYSLSPGYGLGAFGPYRGAYDVFKSRISAQINPAIALSAAVSYDTEGSRYRNGLLLHAGVSTEPRRFPFWAGYEIGIRPDRSFFTVHHIWAGLDFKRLSGDPS
jgi:hypothetical protein